MSNKLLIAPGVASPVHYPQNLVYNNLIEEANLNNIETDLIVYPGQTDNNLIEKFYRNKIEILTIQAATISVTDKIKSLESNEKPYYILARSFGCLIALNSIRQANPSYLTDIILWGITPFATMYAYFNKDTFIQDCKNKGTVIGTLSDNSLPVEYLVKTYNNNAKIRFCCGDKDEICTSAFIDYLLTLQNTPHEKVVVKDATHEGVSKNQFGYDLYINALLRL